MTKRGGACASLAERGRLRRPGRGDYLSFVAHQTRAGGRRHRTRPARTFYVAEAFSPEGARTILDRPSDPARPSLSTSSAIHGAWPIALALDRTHTDFSATASALLREAQKRVITRECAYNISLECKDANDDRAV